MSSAPVDELLAGLVSNIHAALGDDLVGVHLYGSYVSAASIRGSVMSTWSP